MKAIYVFVMIFLFNLCLSRTTDRIWQGWVKRESGSAGYRQVNGDEEMHLENINSIVDTA